MITYLSAQEILVIHALIVDEIGGTHGLRDLHLLQSLVERPKTSFGGKDMHPSIFAKAAVYLESLSQYHVFVDGNKRTSLVVTARFLELNGYRLVADNTEAERFVLHAAQKKFSLEEITQWLEKNSQN